MAAHHDYVCAYTGDVISYSEYCDGKYDCPYYDDEDCPASEYCPYQTHHKCSDNGACIHHSRLCDGYADCPNAEDESYYECARAKSINTDEKLTSTVAPSRK